MKVTVIIFSYNNLKYIYEAIDSVLQQNYENIQLIVTDDGSKNFDSVAIKSYIEQNKKNNIKEFIVRTNEKNLGTVHHVNKALEYVKGEYIVNLAADDMLYDEKVVANYVKYNTEINDENIVALTQVKHYNQDMTEELCDVLTPERIALLENGSMSEIYGELCQWCFIPEAGTALSVKLIERLGGFDERYQLIEDWPFFLKAVRSGIRFKYFNTVSTKHRDGGVSHSKRDKNNLIQNSYYNDLLEINRNEILKYYKLAPQRIQKKIYTAAHDRVIIYEFRNEFVRLSLRKKMYWIYKNPIIFMVFIRGVKRKVIRGFYTKCLKKDCLL